MWRNHRLHRTVNAAGARQELPPSRGASLSGSLWRGRLSGSWRNGERSAKDLAGERPRRCEQAQGPAPSWPAALQADKGTTSTSVSYNRGRGRSASYTRQPLSPTPGPGNRAARTRHSPSPPPHTSRRVCRDESGISAKEVMNLPSARQQQGTLTRLLPQPAEGLGGLGREGRTDRQPGGYQRGGSRRHHCGCRIPGGGKEEECEDAWIRTHEQEQTHHIEKRHSPRRPACTAKREALCVQKPVCRCGSWSLHVDPVHAARSHSVTTAFSAATLARRLGPHARHRGAVRGLPDTQTETDRGLPGGARKRRRCGLRDITFRMDAHRLWGSAPQPTQVEAGRESSPVSREKGVTTKRKPHRGD